MLTLLFLLLPLAALTGWYTGKKQFSAPKKESLNRKRLSSIPAEYFRGLNHLINEEPDKAVDVFVKMLEVNNETIETHLALGSLFRRRGETDRAIRIHQNLIARPQLNVTQRAHALSELGMDYFRAGLLDRAENLFLELVSLNAELPTSYEYLLSIYQLQKAWDKAISIAKKLEAVTSAKMRVPLAHYHCELAEKALLEADLMTAKNYLKKALAFDKNCVRANLILGKSAVHAKEYVAALSYLAKVKQQDPAYLSEILPLLVTCYTNLSKEKELIDYLHRCLKQHGQISTVLILTEQIKKNFGAKAAIEFLSKEAKSHLSLRAASFLLDFSRENVQGEVQKNLQLLQDFITRLLENMPNYRCTECGFSGKLFYWQCPSCRRWSTVKPVQTEVIVA